MRDEKAIGHFASRFIQKHGKEIKIKDSEKRQLTLPTLIARAIRTRD